MKRSGLYLFLAALVLVSCAGNDGGGIAVRDAWSRQSPAMAHTGGVFLVIENSGEKDDALLRVTTDVCETVELHELVLEDDVMKMRPVAGGRIEVPAGGSVELKPGGLHVMLIGLKQELEPGTTFELVLNFETAGSVPVQVTVKEAGEMGG